MSDAADKLARSRLAISERLLRRERRDEKKEAMLARNREEVEQDEQGWDQSEEDEDPARWFARLNAPRLRGGAPSPRASGWNWRRRSCPAMRPENPASSWVLTWRSGALS